MRENKLKEYIDNDEFYQEWKNGKKDFSDFEWFCIEHCQDIEEILEENEELRERISILKGLQE